MRGGGGVGGGGRGGEVDLDTWVLVVKLAQVVGNLGSRSNPLLSLKKGGFANLGVAERFTNLVHPSTTASRGSFSGSLRLLHLFTSLGVLVFESLMVSATGCGNVVGSHGVG